MSIDRLSLADKWVLDRLNNCAKEMNHNMDIYDYSEVTVNFRTFWLENFCDVYLENAKLSLKQESNSESSKNTTKAVLFTIIESGMRLLHPIMPFITEELYQKLPDFEGKRESVSIAEYPEFSNNMVFNNEFETFNDVIAIMSVVRSMLGTVPLPPKTYPNVYLQFEDSSIKMDDYIQQVSQCVGLIKTLAKSGEISWVSESNKCPDGCIVKLATQKNIKVCLDVKAHINVDAEIKKVEKKMADIIKKRDWLAEKQQKSDYNERVPEKVRVEETKKLTNMNVELDTLTKSINNFLKMK